MDQGHGDAGAVLSGDKDLAHHDIGQIVLGGRCPKQRARTVVEAEPLDTARLLVIVDLKQQMIIGSVVAPECYAFELAEVHRRQPLAA